MSRIFSSVGNHSTSKNYEVTKMFKSVFAATAALSMSAGAAFAGPYVNVEANSGWTGSDYNGTATDLHVGYEGALGESAAWYVQGGGTLVLLMALKKISSPLVKQVSLLLLLRHWESMVKSLSLVPVMRTSTVDMVASWVSSTVSDN